MAGQATYADALPHFPDRSNTGTQCNDTPHYFVPGYAWRLQRWIGIFDIGGVGTADAAGFDFDQYFAVTGLRCGALHQFQNARRTNLHGAVGCFHRFSFFIHRFSDANRACASSTPKNSPVRVSNALRQAL